MILQPPRESLKKLVNLRDPVLAGNVGRCVTCIHFEFHSCRQNLIMWHEIYGADCQHNHIVFCRPWFWRMRRRTGRQKSSVSRSCVNTRRWAFVKVMCEHEELSICQGHVWTKGGEHLSRSCVNTRRWAFVKVMCEHKEVSICQGHVWTRGCELLSRACEHKSVSRLHVKKRKT